MLDEYHRFEPEMRRGREAAVEARHAISISCRSTPEHFAQAPKLNRSTTR